MSSLLKTGEGVLFYLGVLLVSLIALYGLAHIVIRYSPQPLSDIINGIVSRSTPGGWTGSSNS